MARRRKRSLIPHMPASPGVYRLDVPGTTHFYIGSSKNMRARAFRHCDRLARGFEPAKIAIACEIVKRTPVFSVVESCGVADLPAREGHWIETLRPTLNSYVSAAHIASGGSQSRGAA